MIITATTLPLDSSNATLARAGGKGANLAELARAGFAVPPGFLVSTDAYWAFIEANRIGERLLALAKQAAPDDPVALDTASEEIRALFTAGEIPEEIASEIVAAYQALGEDASIPVAVRSSATAEDLPGLSFAGQQDTYLNIVGPDALLDAVKRCWGSLWTARAIGYRARNQISPENVALAVVVQQMIASETSGVLFTANPLTGRRDEIVIDASFGLGEAIVSGQVEPDHYVMDPRTWSITACKLGAKALAIIPQAGGGTAQVARDGAQQQALPDAQILELARVARRVAGHFGAPQDIEWAWAGGQLYLLQSRPITSLYPLPEGLATSGEPQLYWCFNSVQGVVDPFTPLGRDAIRLIASGFLRLLRLERPIQEMLPDAGERLFINITGATQFFRGAFAMADPVARQTLVSLIDEGRVPLNQPFTPATLRRLLPNLLPILGRALVALRSPEFARARALGAAESYLAEVRQHAAAAGTLSARLAAMEQDLSRVLTDLGIKIIPCIAPAIAMMGLIDRWLVEWLGMRPGAVLALLRGLPGNVTTEMDLRLWALVQEIRADPQARAALLDQPVEAQVEAYRRGALPAVAQRAIGQFMAQYGVRAVAEIDFGRPRWRDDPAQILQMVHGYLQLEDPNLAPDLMFQRGAEEAQRMAADVVAQAGNTRFGGLRAKLLGGAIRRMRVLAGLRESPKFYVIQMFGIYHAALLDSARDLVARGVLECPEDIFFVPLETLKRMAGGEPIDLKALVAARRAAYDHERARRRMPRLLLNSGEVFYEGPSAAGANDLTGDPVSPGVVEGIAHVVHDPRGVRLAPGEILVCPATDPGWTPLFLTAGGLVMEIGGMVTHGSVVAREYGIPAVVGVQGATTRITSGQRLRVDGTIGRVTVLDEEESS